MFETCSWATDSATRNLPPPSIPPEANKQDLLKNYKEFYGKRMQYLERMKLKFNSSDSNCSSEQTLSETIDPPAICAHINSGVEIHPQTNLESFSNTFERLQQDMLSLMENDVSLLGQLLSLSESVDELKRWASVSPASSCMSLTDIEDESLTPRAINQFTVNDSESSSEEVLSSPPALYFSRKNSVLRIPIPPSHRPSRSRTITSIVSCEEEESSSGVSSSASSSMGSLRTNSLNNKRRLRLSIAAADSESGSSGASSGSGSPNKSLEPSHEVQDSLDSGISGMIHLAVQNNDKKDIEVYV